MIKQNEIRVGNYIWFLSPITNNATIAKVHEILSGSLRVKCNNGMIQDLNYSSANPIELNEDVFEKCGFVENGSITQLYKSPLHLIKSYDGWQMQQSSGYVGKKVLHYLHEIQNLYFGLMGEEIEFKGFND